jgi:hypothetical protein
MKIVYAQRELPHVIDALGAPRRLARGLNGRQQQRDQHADDGNHHQQLDQRKALMGDSLGSHRKSFLIAFRIPVRWIVTA